MLHGFAFTMLVGIITGTYSSVFIAAAIVSFWRGDGADPRRRPRAGVDGARQRAAAADAPVEAAAQGPSVR